MNASTPSCRRSFTLTELLVAMGIIAIIGGVTALGIREVARDARLSSATNTVSAALETARSIAIQENRTVLVAFRPVRDGDSTRIEVVTAGYAGDARNIQSSIIYPYDPPQSPPSPRIVDRFRPIPGIARRVLPKDVFIAGPFFAVRDNLWVVPSDLARPGEGRGRMVGVMFSGDGTTLMQDPTRNTHFVYVDFNDNGRQEPNHLPSPAVFIDDWFEVTEPEDEPLVQMVRFVAVFDYAAAREELDPSMWVDADMRHEELSGYITDNADRIHFNRYTGVAMR